MLAVWMLTLVPAASAVQTYGYRQGEDPFVRHVRALVAGARDGAWADAASALEQLGPFVGEVRDLYDVDPGSRIAAAIESRDLAAVLSGIVELTALSILGKLHHNEQEELRDRTRAKDRLRRAEEYYGTILAGNVRRDDRGRETKRDERIRVAFQAARHALGSPGVLGIGGWDPDPAAFREAAATLRTELRAAFPSMPDPTTGARREPADSTEPGASEDGA